MLANDNTAIGIVVSLFLYCRLENCVATIRGQYAERSLIGALFFCSEEKLFRRIVTMHKCFKCGTEFEGKFCPECGTQWLETKNCPQCGAALAGSAKFCNNCGYSFVESAEAKRKKQPSKIGIFFKKVWAWIRAHLKVIIPTACSLVVAIVICSLIPTFIAMGVNGTYYAYSFDEKGEIVYSEKDYITLSSGKWKDSDGNKGTYSRSGKNVTLKYRDQAAEDFGDIMGDLGVEIPTEVKLKATVVNGVLTVTDGTREETYATKSHKHKYGKWEVTKEPTCTLQGEQKHSCSCKKFETEVLDIKHGEVRDGRCVICGQTQLKYVETQIRKPYELADGSYVEHYINGYAVCGFAEGFTESENVEILAEYEGLLVIEIGDLAFYSCKLLKSVTIPNSVTYIGEHAFNDAYKLTSIYYAGDIADWCAVKGLKYLLSSKVYIGNQKLDKMTSITIPDGVRRIENNAFAYCKDLKSVTIPNSVTYIGTAAFYYCSSLTSITIGNSVASIGASAFEGCKGLTSITIPNSVTYIGEHAFNDAYKLTSIYYAGNVANWCSIDGLYYLMERDRTLYIDGKELTGDLVIPNGVTSIGAWAFAFCTGLTSITIPGSVTSIGQQAFFGCSGLTSVTIGNSVTSIGMQAFDYCSSLTSIQFNGTKAQWKKIKKDDDYCTNNCTVQCTDGKLDKEGNEIE